MNRRDFLATCGNSAIALGLAPDVLRASAGRPAPDATLHIAPATVELAPGRRIDTIAYNGTVPGPVLRFTEGATVTIDVVNDTDREELVHWHGLWVPSNVDGSMEEGTTPVPAHGRQSYTFTARPAGTRWYHTHAFAGRDLHRGGYTGQFGFLIVDPASEPGRYDQEVFLALHDWRPYIMGSDDGYQMVGYNTSSINGRILGAGQPISVREGQRVFLRILNASATDAHWLALPGHRFNVVALDGNPVPTPAAVDQLLLNPGERVDAVVEMNQPGVWILGEVRDQIRDQGMGIVVEYAGRTGPPQWVKPSQSRWSYLDFGRPGTGANPPTERIPLVFQSLFKGHGAFEHWTINGKSYPDTDVVPLEQGHRYRLVFDNRSTEDHPVHLHRHVMELASVSGVPTWGIHKDVITVPAQSTAEADFTADNPGKTLFHCHLQEHMDSGFMMLFDYR